MYERTCFFFFSPSAKIIPPVVFRHRMNPPRATARNHHSFRFASDQLVRRRRRAEALLSKANPPAASASRRCRPSKTPNEKSGPAPIPFRTNERDEKPKRRTVDVSCATQKGSSQTSEPLSPPRAPHSRAWRFFCIYLCDPCTASEGRHATRRRSLITGFPIQRCQSHTRHAVCLRLQICQQTSSMARWELWTINPLLSLEQVTVFLSLRAAPSPLCSFPPFDEGWIPCLPAS